MARALGRLLPFVEAGVSAPLARRSYGEELLSFASRAIAPGGRPRPLARAVAKAAAALLPDAVDAPGLEAQLNDAPFFSSADHHSLPNIGIHLNSLLAHAETARTLGLKYAVSLCTDYVPCNNLAFPGGVALGGKRLSFVSDRDIRRPVFSLPAADDGVSDARRFSSSLPDAEFLGPLLREGLAMGARGGRGLSAQISAMNARILPLLYPAGASASLPVNVCVPWSHILPALIAEDIDEGGPLRRILFSRADREAALEAFDGIQGCWSGRGAARGGTHFLWATRPSGRLEPMRVEGDRLVSASASIRLEPDEVMAAIAEGRAAPGLFLAMEAIAFRGGLSPLGGFNQRVYLARMRDARVAYGKDRHSAEELALASRIDPAGLVCGPVGVGPGGAFDILARGSPRGSGTLTEGEIESFLRAPAEELLARGMAELGAAR